MASTTAVDARRRTPNDLNGNRSAAKSRQSTQNGSEVQPASPATRLQLTTAQPGDDRLVRQLLMRVFHGPSTSEFHAQSEHPEYDPGDRIVVKHGEQIVGHVRVTRRQVHFGPAVLPVGGVAELAVLPEYRGRGCGRALVREAEQRLRGEGVLLATIPTRNPQFLLHRGWALCGRHCFSVGAARDILAQLSRRRRPEAPSRASTLLEVAERSSLNIRLWRHVERAALMRLYEENTRRSFGATVRDDAYWRWLMSRRAYDRVYVAVEGADKLELDDHFAPIVGYAAMKDDRLVELMTSPRREEAGSQLLARACSDAIERDRQFLRFDAPPHHPLHGLIVSGGGEHRRTQVENGEVFVARLFDPSALIQKMRRVFHHRARAARLSRPCDLGICVDGEKHLLALTKRTCRIAPGRLGRSYLSCDSSALAQLLLGHSSLEETLANGRVEPSTRVAVETARALFPTTPYWRPPLDDLPA